MQTFIYVDSNNRLESNTINDFVITADMTKNWIRNATQVGRVPVGLNGQILDYKFSIRLPSIVIFLRSNLPANEIIIPALIKLNFYNTLYNDRFGINTMNDVDNDYKFMCTYFRDISYPDPTDNNYTIKEVIYQTNMIQTIRLKRDGEFVFSIKNYDGLDIDNLSRVLCLLWVLPLENDIFFFSNSQTRQ